MRASDEGMTVELGTGAFQVFLACGLHDETRFIRPEVRKMNECMNERRRGSCKDVPSPSSAGLQRVEKKYTRVRKKTKHSTEVSPVYLNP